MALSEITATTAAIAAAIATWPMLASASPARADVKAPIFCPDWGLSRLLGICSDGELAEDRPRDMTQNHHHVAKCRWRPDQFLTFRGRADGEVGDLLLVDGERCFFEMGAHPGTDLAGPYHQHPNPVFAQRFAHTKVEAVQTGFGGAVDEIGTPYPL